MTNEEILLQTLGTNEDAKTTLTNVLTEYFPQVVSELSLPERIIEKFYDWMFPFVYTTDGAGARKWSVSVRALCERNPKLADLDAFFNASGTDGTFKESYSGNDTETNTDNSARRTKTEFDGVGDPTSQSTSDSVVVEPVAGQNTTERKTEYGKTRTYADGRTWSQILADVMNTRGPVYIFINSFAQILREPSEDCEQLPDFPPSMQMKIKIDMLDPNAQATASVTNQGTPYNAVFDLLLGIPQGKQGNQGIPGEPGKDGTNGTDGTDGTDGIDALMSTYVLNSDSDPSVSDQITIPASSFSTFFSRDPALNDECIFIAKNTTSNKAFILGVKCTNSSASAAVFTVNSVVLTSVTNDNIVTGQTVGNPASGKTYVQCSISGTISTDGNYYFINCSGTITVSGTSPKIYITDSPNLTVNGITSSNWRNIFIDGVAKYEARTASISLPGGYSGGYTTVASNVQNGDTVEIAFRSYENAQKVYTFRINESSFKFAQFVPLGVVTDNGVGSGNYGYVAHVNYENNTLKAGMVYYGKFSQDLSGDSNLSCAWVTLFRRIDD